MPFFRQYIAPFFIFLIFLVTLALVSSRIFLPDMAAPAPVEIPAAEQLETAPNQQAVVNNTENAQVTLVKDTVANLPPALSTLVKGLPDDSSGQF